jgi:hypothetical protein
MKFQVPRNQILKWTAFAAAVLIVTRLFFVQQLIAAFLIFSALFVCLAAVALVLFVLDYAWQAGFARAEAYVKTAARPEHAGRVSFNSSGVASLLATVVEHRTTPGK